MVTDAMIERFARAMFGVWPLHAVSTALSEQSGLPVGAVLTYDKVLEMGGNHDGLLRLASGAAALHAEIITRPTADLGEDGELVAGLHEDAKVYDSMLHRAHAARCQQAADRIELYREALEMVALLGKNAEEGHLADDEAWAMMAREVSALLSRSGDD